MTWRTCGYLSRCINSSPGVCSRHPGFYRLQFGLLHRRPNGVADLSLDFVRGCRWPVRLPGRGRDRADIGAVRGSRCLDRLEFVRYLEWVGYGLTRTPRSASNSACARPGHCTSGVSAPSRSIPWIRASPTRRCRYWAIARRRTCCSMYSEIWAFTVSKGSGSPPSLLCR